MTTLRLLRSLGGWARGGRVVVDQAMLTRYERIGRTLILCKLPHVIFTIRCRFVALVPVVSYCIVHGQICSLFSSLRSIIQPNRAKQVSLFLPPFAVFFVISMPSSGSDEPSNAASTPSPPRTPLVLATRAQSENRPPERRKTTSSSGQDSAAPSNRRRPGRPCKAQRRPHVDDDK